MDVSELARQFALGNAAILTNACLLPLYPGLIAFLAGTADDARTRRATGWLGLLVLAGILAAMVAIGFALYLLNATFGDALQYVLPIIYLAVIAFGALMLLGRSPFATLTTAQAPVLRNPYATAFVYGLFFGPMTLPCTGPIITAAFLLGTAQGGSLAAELLYVAAFGLGFGWPLLALPLIALPLQRRLVGWLARHHDALTRASGVLLVAVGVFGALTELLPNYIPSIELDSSAQMLFWLAAAVITVGVGVAAYRREMAGSEGEDK